MPGRHVRFSSENIFHSPPPPPLMSPSSSSSTSSYGPLTPPPLPYAGLPGPTPFVPPSAYTKSSAGKGRAHSLIAQSSTPLLNYDISLHPSSISTHYMGVSSAGLVEPAVYPPQPAISLATPYLPWAIGVVASNRRYVTVSDVLNSVYHALRANVTPAEFNALDTQKLMRRAAAAYTKRCERLRGHRGYAEEKMQGVKRIDFLMGHTKFQGISPGVGAPGMWQIHIG
ncbi:hypothetical protein FB451DRAFT_1272522 [Mycena latifolia]|nr:hypothetical protein FB451DRAFT_1272522 [Mycena latifolia]